MAQDYIYAVTPILEDALMDRDLVHRWAPGLYQPLAARMGLLQRRDGA